MTGVQGEQNTLLLGTARWRPVSWYSTGEVKREKWGKWEVMLASQPLSAPQLFSSVLCGAPIRAGDCSRSPQKAKRWWREREEGIERGAENRGAVENNGCLFISLRSEEKGWNVALHPHSSVFFGSCSLDYYGKLNMTFKPHQNFKKECKWSAFSIQITLKQYVETLTLDFITVSINSHCILCVYIWGCHPSLTDPHPDASREEQTNK